MSSDFERCDHGSIGAYCPDCQAETIAAAQAVATPTRSIGKVISAGHAGDCACCGFRFPADTQIQWVDDGDRILGWVVVEHLLPKTEPLLKHDISCERGYCHPSCPIQSTPHPERTV